MKSFDDWARELADHVAKKTAPEPTPRLTQGPVDAEFEGPCLLCNEGTYQIRYPIDGACSCFRNAPCGYCTTNDLVCDTCGHEVDVEE